MRPARLIIAAACAACAAAASLPAFAQSAASVPGAASTPSNTVQLGRPPAPLGSTTTLNDRIDAAAGARTTGAANGLSRPGAVVPGGGAAPSGRMGGVDSGVVAAGRPAGAPLGPDVTDPIIPPSPR